MAAEKSGFKQKNVIIAGPFPPPVNGFSYITQEMEKLLTAYHKTVRIDLSPHLPRNARFYHLRRIRLTLRGAIILLKNAGNSERVFYTACEGNLGIAYTLTLSFIARILGYPIFIHHHSFGYIESHSALMDWLVKTAGNDATHIFLCQEMASRFAERYSIAVKASIVSNSAFVPLPSQLTVSNVQEPLVIGLLSNLNEEKGLGLFLEVLRVAIERNMPITAVLAGPPQSDLERDVIAAACREFGSRLEYRGPIYGTEKDAFFRSINVFIFPTRYANEAQPTVIFEALSYGIPVISYDRGCICSQAQHYGAVAARDAEFVPFAMDWLQKQLTSPEAFMQLRLDAQAAFAQDRAAAQYSVAVLFDSPAPRVSPVGKGL